MVSMLVSSNDVLSTATGRGSKLPPPSHSKIHWQLLQRPSLHWQNPLHLYYIQNDNLGFEFHGLELLFFA